MNDNDPELEKIRERRAAKLGREIDILREWPDRPIEITDDDFRDITARYPLILLDMWAPWCGPCRMMSPVLEGLAEEYRGKVLIGKINVDENPKISKTFKVMSIPTLLIIKERELVDRMTGAVSRTVLVNRLRPHLEMYK